MKEKKTVLITGASSGIGAAAVELFHHKGWRTAAAMRHPESRETPVHRLPGVMRLHMDVTDPVSVKLAVEEARRLLGRVDVLVNNAGYAVVGPFEASTPEQARRQFDTNVFGLMAVIREVLPAMREQGGGTIINIASIGGRMVFPLYSLYHGTKWAVEGFTESLQHELRSFNIRVKLVEPGPIKTDFYSRSLIVMKGDGFAAYHEYAEKVLARMNDVAMKMGAAPEKAAAAIYRAANSRSRRLRYPVGANGVLILRRFLPDGLFNRLIRLAAG